MHNIPGTQRDAVRSVQVDDENGNGGRLYLGIVYWRKKLRTEDDYLTDQGEHVTTQVKRRDLTWSKMHWLLDHLAE